MDDWYPSPFDLEGPYGPEESTDVNLGREESAWRFQCIIHCRHKRSANRAVCREPIKCSYGAWTRLLDGGVGNWKGFVADRAQSTNGDEISFSKKIWLEKKGLTGEVWFYPPGNTWGSLIDSGTSTKIKMVYDDKGNEEGEYYHPILDRWITLVAGKSQCISTVKVFCLECPVTPALAFDDASTSDTIAPGGNITMYVTGGLGPFNWSTSSTGYTFGSAQTSARNNTLTSASGTCGVHYDPYADITVTDACGTSVSFEIRNTGGTWGAYTDPGIILTGNAGATCVLIGGGPNTGCTKTVGKYQQYQETTTVGGSACTNCCVDFDNSPTCGDAGGTWCDNSLALVYGKNQGISDKTICDNSVCPPPSGNGPCFFNHVLKYRTWQC